jgi:hypothetical protein
MLLRSESEDMSLAGMNSSFAVFFSASSPTSLKLSSLGSLMLSCRMIPFSAKLNFGFSILP